MSKFTAFRFIIIAELFLGCASLPKKAPTFSELPGSPIAPRMNGYTPASNSIPICRVSIDYEVQRPGDYAYTNGMTVQDLVAAAGGLGDFASGVVVSRGGTNLFNRYFGSRRRMIESECMMILLKPGERVRVKRRE